MSERVPQPAELIYVPEASWHPVLVAAGLAGLVAGMFTWWPYAVVGAIVALCSLALWIRGVGRDVERLPRRQRTISAPLPPTALDGDTPE